MDNPVPTTFLHLIYCKHYDVRAQLLRGVWLIAVKSLETRSSVLRRTISIGDMKLTVYPDPYKARGTDGTPEIFVIKDILLVESNATGY